MLAKRLLCFLPRRFAAFWWFSLTSFAPRSLFVAGLIGGAALTLGGCAQQPPLQRVAHSKEYFPSSIYGAASERVVADGETVPRGGGAYMVGKPYSVAGHTYYPSEKQYAATGLASWYGDAFHGRRTANGEVYDREGITAAHPTMPLPSYARVTNLRNNYSMIVRVNDRGPFAANRIMDVSRKTAEALDFRRTGTAKVKVEYIGAASIDGSDDAKLLATLRLDGPARLDGRDGGPPTMVAEREPFRTASAEPVQIARVAQVDESETASIPEPPARNAVGRSFAGVAPLPPARPFDLGMAPAGRVRVATRQANN
ncbi:MAG: septal ring lytic transglycosylase RlpA family protein [Methylocella sp.]